jgi:hypothetical protein
MERIEVAISTPPRKRADFQPVVDDEKTHRTIHRRKSK